MTSKRTPPGGRNIVIHGNAINTTATSGDGNTVITGQKQDQSRQGTELADLLELIERLQSHLPEAGLDRHSQAAIAKDLEQAKEIASDPEAPKHLLKRALESVTGNLKAVVKLGGVVEKMVPWAEKAGELAARLTA
jgi:hypothetical protein